ncbi:MAG: ATP-dependent Clp protease proteolytic subunit, partial [Candidatus Rokubacteria bacterium]|nr:ATP-dependent Clp protease proteolytic subunit [Candidatus Rokubacteria bacterium]
GQAASMAAILLAAGEKGKRHVLPHARVMIHQPHGGVQGQASDIHIHAEEIIKLRRQMNEILADHTGKAVDLIEKDSDRDRFLSAQAAVEYGICDQIMRRHERIHAVPGKGNGA